MISTGRLLKEWQAALRAEIYHLKTYGSTKYYLKNGIRLNEGSGFSYFFTSRDEVRIPNGTTARLQWNDMDYEGRILSSEGKGIILSFDRDLGDLIAEGILFHDPWKLLDELSCRLDEIRESPKKRRRIKDLMDPSPVDKHPKEKASSSLHELVLRTKYNHATFVWGPPGTGKTYTLARLAGNKYNKKQRILILSHSNQAVNVLMTEISAFLAKKNKFREGDILRYGGQGDPMLPDSVTMQGLLEKSDPVLAGERQKLSEERKLLKQDLNGSFSQRDSQSLLELETRLAAVLEKVRQKETEFVKDADIIGTTLAKAASDPAIYEGEFDLVILDEVSQAYIPQAGFAASLGRRIVVCGDFKQLPPIAASRHSLTEKWLKDDIFHAAGVSGAGSGEEMHPQLFLLREQRRMHPDISAFTNSYIYQSLVTDHESVAEARRPLAELSPFPGHASVLLDTSYTGAHCITDKVSHSRMNLFHLFLSFQVIHEAYSAGSRSIGYMAPYRAQAMLMDTLLKDLYNGREGAEDIAASTVHRFQGSEREVMIFDSVDTHTQTRPGMLLTGKDSERLINVAVTRTKGKFVHISDASFIRKNIYPRKTIRQLVDYQIKQKQIVSPAEIGSWIKNSHPKLKWVYARNLEGIKRDLSAARNSIYASLPAGIKAEKDLEELLGAMSGEAMARLRTEENADIPFPFIIIDSRILWYGMPLHVSQWLQPPYLSIRLDSVPFIKHFLAAVPGSFQL
ncbi:AAA domain-containing protein [Peribacillus sp. SCS-37]|uniref:AAA domain-containing protein n=1 Tax=Paraperibacillus esterisolvens TaxID=3115296 RepID=UPI0039057D61